MYIEREGRKYRYACLSKGRKAGELFAFTPRIRWSTLKVVGRRLVPPPSVDKPNLVQGAAHWGISCPSLFRPVFSYHDLDFKMHQRGSLKALKDS